MDAESIALFPSTPRPREADRAPLIDRILDDERTLPVALALAIGLRLACVALFAVRPMSDYRWYYDVAASIASGHGAVFHGRPTAYWPIGYAAFLASAFAVTGPSVLVAQLLNVALAAGTLVLAHRVMLVIGGSPRAARAAVILLALWPNQIAYTSLIASETLASFLVLLGAWLLLLGRRWWRDALGGAVLGCACLVKPQAALLPLLVLGVTQLAASRSWQRLRGLVRRAVVAYVALVLVLVPWGVRNWQQFGGPVFVANSGGINLLIGNHAGATGTYPQADDEARLLRMMAPLTIDGDEYRFDLHARALTIEYLKQHPAQALLLTPRKLWHLYAKDADGFSWIQQGAPASDGRYRLLLPLKGIAQAYYVFVLLAVATSLFVTLRRRQALALLVPISVVSYFTCVYLVFFGVSRFHFVTAPWLAICAAFGVGATFGARATSATVSAAARRG